jgi:hypothetical protein
MAVVLYHSVVCYYDYLFAEFDILFAPYSPILYAISANYACGISVYISAICSYGNDYFHCSQIIYFSKNFVRNI